MGKKKKSKSQLLLSKAYLPVLLVFVLGILITAAIIDRNKKYDSNNSNESIIMEQGWSINEKTDHAIKIYGSETLSIEPSVSDTYHEYYCQNEECLFIHGNNNYALLDDGKYVVFSLIDGAVFDVPKDYDLDEAEFLVSNNVLYGLIFINNDEHEIYYSLSDEKYFFENSNYYVDRTSRYVVANRQILIHTEEKDYLYSLDTNSILIEAKYLEVNPIDNDYYIKAYNNDMKLEHIYSSNLYEIKVDGAKLLDVYNKMFIYTVDGKTFNVKNMENELVLTSKVYDNILDFIEGYVIAKQEDNLLILNQNDEIVKYIAMRNLDYDNYHSHYEIDDREGLDIYLVKDGHGIEIFFNPSTSEYIETNY